MNIPSYLWNSKIKIDFVKINYPKLNELINGKLHMWKTS